ncbi:MAG TPA: hypothetical protein V6D02_14925, partial [Candidatus Obscuribacterales bacterium]
MMGKILTPPPPMPPLDAATLGQWLPDPLHQRYVSVVMGRVGMTRRRADCFVRLWLYLLLKDCEQRAAVPPAPLAALAFPAGGIACSCREAAAVFYGDQERGSDRS